jgi:hypothetical protein
MWGTAKHLRELEIYLRRGVRCPFLSKLPLGRVPAVDSRAFLSSHSLCIPKTFDVTADNEPLNLKWLATILTTCSPNHLSSNKRGWFKSLQPSDQPALRLFQPTC